MIRKKYFNKEAFGNRKVFGFLGIIGWKILFFMFGIYFKKITLLEKDVFRKCFLISFSRKHFMKEVKILLSRVNFFLLQ